MSKSKRPPPPGNGLLVKNPGHPTWESHPLDWFRSKPVATQTIRSKSTVFSYGAAFSSKLFPRGRPKTSHRGCRVSLGENFSTDPQTYLLRRYKEPTVLVCNVPVHPVFPSSYIQCLLDSRSHLRYQQTSHPIPSQLKHGSIPLPYHTVIMILQSKATPRTT